MLTTQISPSEKAEAAFVPGKKEQSQASDHLFSDVFSAMNAEQVPVDVEGLEAEQGALSTLPEGFIMPSMTPVEGLSEGEISGLSPSVLNPMSSPGVVGSLANEAAILAGGLQGADKEKTAPGLGIEFQALVSQLSSLTSADKKSLNENPASQVVPGELLADRVSEVAGLNVPSEDVLESPDSLIPLNATVNSPLEASSQDGLELIDEESEEVLAALSPLLDGEVTEDAMQPFGLKVAEINSDSRAVKSEDKELMKATSEDIVELAQMNSDIQEQVAVTGTAPSSPNASPVASQAGAQSAGPTSSGPSNHVAQWGTQSTDAQANQAFGQGSQQSSQGGQQPQQQAMMASQSIQEGKDRALEQQLAVKAVNEAMVKAEGKDILTGADIASGERRGLLPLGLQSINLPVNHSKWGQALGQRVVFMANNNLQQAQLTLNPEKLGKIQVMLQLDKDNVMNVTMVAQNGTTRESMENALPRLREMLEQAGINLGSVDVNEQKQFTEDSSEDSGSSKESIGTNLVEDESQEADSLSVVKSTDSLVDYYV